LSSSGLFKIFIGISPSVRPAEERELKARIDYRIGGEKVSSLIQIFLNLGALTG
jgi:hypothetical protein